MEQSNNNPHKEEILTLLLADMRNRKLLMGLEATGLCTDDFNTNLIDLIFSKLEIPKEYEVIVYNWYEDSIYTLLNTDLNKFREHQHFFANTLYRGLLEKKIKSELKRIIKKKCGISSFLRFPNFMRFDN